jgi:hypothetical protein
MRHAHDLRTLLLTALAGCSGTVTSTDASAPTERPVDDVIVPVDVPSIDVATDGPARDTAPDAAAVCPGPSARECLTEAQVESRIRTPPMGGGGPVDAGADVPPIDVPREPNGCYQRSAVRDGCCIAASAVEREGDLCCYTFCQGACCGRPFTVGSAMRAAPLAGRSSWGTSPAPPPRRDPSLEAVARAWRDDARMEHASVASFARFTLHLLALGAPPDLVIDAQRAGIDEVEHTRLCLAVAASIDGRDLGPDALDVAGSLGAVTLLDALRAAVTEGCVGETFAALTVRRRAELARSEAVRATLARIADDEARHAALSWRFAAWAIARGGDEARAVAAQAFAVAVASIERSGGGAAEAPDAVWNAHGLLTASDLRAVFVSCRSDVLAPCAEALLGGAVRG